VERTDFLSSGEQVTVLCPLFVSSTAHILVMMMSYSAAALNFTNSIVVQVPCEQVEKYVILILLFYPQFVVEILLA
jgi:hypothetical protein